MAQETKLSKLYASVSYDKEKNKVIKIQFPYDHSLIERVRSLPGRRWHPEIKCWSAPVYISTVKKLAEWGFHLDEELRAAFNKTKEKSSQIRDVKKGIPGLNGTLYPFQADGVAFVESRNGKALIADEMGLGKTIQALGWLTLRPEKRPAIIIVPANVKLKWANEAKKWMPNPKVEVLSGSKPWKTEGDIIIINYDILAAWVNYLKTLEPQAVVFDEVHYIKSNKALRTKAAKALVKSLPLDGGLIGLSGTPILSRPIEPYNFLRMAAPDVFGDAWRYVHRYCNARHTGFGWDFTGNSHLDELHHKLTSSVMIRRLKKDVLKDLPEKVHSMNPLELDNRAEYDKAEKDFIEYLKEYRDNETALRAKNAESITQINTLKQIAVKGKLNQVIGWIKDFLETDQKLVVFAVHHFAVDAIVENFPNITVKVDGRENDKEKYEAQVKFQTDPSIRLFVGGIRSAGVGMDLYAASNVVFVELPWTPGDLDQASDRCHRIGQTERVTVHYLLATDTVEDKIAQLLDNKRRVISSVIDGQPVETESLLSELLREYLNNETS